VRLLALVLFLIIGLHYLIASLRYGSVKGLIRIGLFVPYYLVWKTWVFIVSMIKERNLGWNRTERD